MYEILIRGRRKCISEIKERFFCNSYIREILIINFLREEEEEK